MTDALIAEFLATFDERRYPEEFLQHYELLECLSHNALGETLLVKDRQRGDHAVAKCYTDRSLLSQTAESDLLKKLHHPGLPAYIGEYQNETMRCVVREYAPGMSLDRVVREKALSRQQITSIVVQLCDILAYLHGQRPAIIHRDIKPQNIIVDEQGKITLIDFGISRAYDESAQEDTLNFGTRHYAPPEQYGFSQTDCRSDIYSLGVLLCWLLTGRADVQQAKKAIPDLRLAKIVERCTAFAPKDRFRNAAQVRDAVNGRTLRRRVLVSSFLVLSLMAAALWLNYAKIFQLPGQSGVTFEEPLIEQAVRLALEKEPGEALSEQDLLAVTELYVFGDQPAGDEETFHTIENSFINNDGTVLRGSIRVLDDLARLKNLRKLSLCYQNITDLGPLANLIYLESVDLRHNPFEDVSPLSGLSSLSALVVFDTHVSDLTSLSSCLQLSIVDAGQTRIQSTAAVEGLISVRSLVLRGAPLRSLEKLDGLPLLEEIDLAETQLLDLSPLLTLPRLQVVKVDERMQSAVKAIEKAALFEIRYQ